MATTRHIKKLQEIAEQLSVDLNYSPVKFTKAGIIFTFSFKGDDYDRRVSIVRALNDNRIPYGQHMYLDRFGDLLDTSIVTG